MIKNILLLFLVFSNIFVHSQSFFSEGVKLYEKDEYEKALTYFKEWLYILELDKSEKDLITETEMYIADCYSQMNNHEKASVYANRVLNNDSLNKTALLINLKSGIAANDFSIIFQTTNVLINELKLEESFAYYYRGLALIEFNNYEEAMTSLIQAYIIDTVPPGLNHQLGCLYNWFNEYEKAIPHLTKSLEHNYEVNKSLHNLAIAYYHKADYATAQYFLNKILGENPNYFQTDKLKRDFNYMQGEIHYNLGFYRKAIPYLEYINDKTFEHYERLTIITLNSYEKLEKDYIKRGELDKSAYFAAKRAERVFNELYIEDGLEAIDRAISMDSSLHYLLFKSQAMILKIMYYIQEEVFDSQKEAMAFSREALDLTHKVYGDILAIEPENEFYLNRYLEDLFFFHNFISEPEIIEKVCELFEKLKQFGYEFDEKIRNTACFNTHQIMEFDYKIMLLELETFEQRFGVKLIDDEE